MWYRTLILIYVCNKSPPPFYISVRQNIYLLGRSVLFPSQDTHLLVGLFSIFAITNNLSVFCGSFEMPKLKQIQYTHISFFMHVSIIT